MIQRIQSIYLFLTTVAAILFLSGTILKLGGGDSSVIKITLSGIYEYKTGISEKIDSSLLLSLPVALAGLVSVINIFLFKNRKLQIRISILGVALSFSGIAAEAYYLYKIGAGIDFTEWAGIKSFLPLIMSILLFLAYRGISKDEQIVKSFDRLR